MEHKEQLERLRQQIPIGIRHGLKLLQQTNGDIHRAQELFEIELIQVIINKTAVSPEIAKEHLLACNYDIACAIDRIDEARFSLSERILRRYKNNKEEALALIVHQVEATDHIQRKFWLPLDEMNHLAPLVYGVLAVHEFLNYEDWEDFSSAIYFYSDIIAAQFEAVLDMPEIAHCLSAAKKRSDAIHEQYKGQDPSLIANVMNSDAEFSVQADFFRKNRARVVERLYSLVVANMALFP